MQSSQAGKAGQSEDQLQPLFDLVVRGARFLDGSSGDIAVHAGAIAKRGRFAGRGRVEHVASGEHRHFVGLSHLVREIMALIGDPPVEPSSQEGART